MSFPSIFQRYDIEFTDRLYDDQEWINSVYDKKIHTTILDVACGTGRSSSQFLKFDANVTGVDQNDEALKLYKIKAEKLDKIKNLNLMKMDINSNLPEGKWDIVLIVGNSIGVFESKRRLEYFVNWVYGHLNASGFLLISMTFPENGPIKMGVEQPKRRYIFSDQLSYDRSFKFEIDETNSILRLKYWVENILIHEDVLSMKRYSWAFVQNLCESCFGPQNVVTDLRFSDGGSEKGAGPYEAFFKIQKI